MRRLADLRRDSRAEHSFLASMYDAGPALLRDSRQSLVCPDRCVLKLPRLLPGWRRALPHELPRESLRKRPCENVRGQTSELGILFGGFGESKAIQLRVDFNRVHAGIIPTAANKNQLSLRVPVDR